MNLPLAQYNCISVTIEQIECTLFYVFPEDFYTNISPSSPNLIQTHSHIQHELHYIRHGICYFDIAGQVVTLQQDDFVLLGRNMIHSYLPATNCSKISLLFDFSFDNSLKLSETERLLQKLIDVTTVIIRSSESLIIKQLLNQIETELIAQKVGWQSNVRALLTLLMISFAHMTPSNSSSSLSKSTIDAYQEKLWPSLIDDFMIKNVSNKVNANDLASILHVSARHINRIFNKLYHCSFHQKQLQMRMDMACHLLRSTSLSVDDISIKVGYESKSSFHSAFKRQLSITPMHYRKLHTSSDVRNP